MKNQIKKIRTQLRMTQQELAKRLRTTQQTIGRWESGKNEIPVSQLRELAVLFDRSVDEILGVERPPEKWRQSPFAISDHEIPYGTLELRLLNNSESFPIGKKARESVLHQLGDLDPHRETKAGSSWLCFWTLDNKIVVANLSSVRQLELIDDDVEEMPSSSNPEVYRVLEDWKQIEDGEMSVKDIGKKLRAGCLELIDDMGGVDEAVKSVTQVRIVSTDGKETWHKLDEPRDALAYSALETESRDVAAQSFIQIESEGYYRAQFVNLSNTAFIEIPKNRYHRLCATES